MKVVRTPGKGAEQLKVLLDNLKNVEGQVGFFPSAKYEDGTPVAYVAAIQEFGDPKHKIPPRSFMRRTIKEQNVNWKNTFKLGTISIAKGTESVDSVMTQLVLKAAADIQTTITLIKSPPLKKATWKARLRKRANKTLIGELKKPLMDTQTLYHSVTGVVVKK